MKKTKIFSIGYFYLSMVWISTVLVSCDKDLTPYQGKEGIYFAVQYGAWNRNESVWPYYNYSTIPFSKVSVADTTILLKVMVTGKLYDFDRPFTVEINPDSTTAILNTHFKPLATTFNIPANSNFTYIPITLLRAADIKTEMKQIGLRLVPNDKLALSFPEWDAIPGYDKGSDPIVNEFDASLHSIRITDWMVKPAIWSGSVGANHLEIGNWGEFSEDKMELICQVMNLNYSQFENTDTMPLALIILITREMSAYLQRKYNEGQPILEKDGRLMFISGVTWTSYVGIPWKK
ncbi:protein of unknown function [Sphingobacterium nematocida]|uniref:DUF4843 domain-containing protein n=1 Tax=Sphingobacterium nematocida TaxID=1513896 RepID=A0A1T5AV00_9SPHI|nr:DUF4843 domain-containing protein [Sphingobacterium nematocida]SKB38796.1 protein of unknown function [Sphingobacterium nematocida]